MANKVFFQASAGTLVELTDLFGFIWPTAAAMWNLRWQVRGFADSHSGATQEDLVARFIQGSGIHGAENLRGACLERTWEEQQEQFAKFLIMDVCSLFESWITQVLLCLEFSDTQQQALGKKLQFPTTTDARGVERGVRAAIQTITQPESRFLRATFYDALRKSKKNSLARVENLMICYRFFKECRNSLAHNGGIADQKAVDAFSAFLPVANSLDLGVSEVPAHNPLVLGTPIRLKLRGVVGLSDIVVRIITTLDAELSRSERAERYFKRRWLEKYGKGILLPVKDAGRRAAKLHRLASGMSLPEDIHTKPLDQWLKTHRLAY